MTRNTESSIEDQYRLAQESAVLEIADQGLATLANMVRMGNIDVSPNFQRRDRWDSRNQSKLIESFFLNLPVPPVYLAEDVASIGTYAVIDGKQRLTAIASFLNDELTLRGLERFSDLNGLKFSDLPRGLQSALGMKSLRVTTLLRQSGEDIKHEVFLRLNTGGEILNAQEIRNVAYRGPLNDAVNELAENSYLRRQFKIIAPSSAPYRSMADAEYVLRFMTLNHSIDEFSGSLRDSMDAFMSRFRFDESMILRQIKDFNIAITFVESVWAGDGFKRPGRDQALTGMFDAQMLAAARLTSAERKSAIKNAVYVRSAIAMLFETPEFDEAVRRATNTPERLRYRVAKVLEVLRGAEK